MKPTLVILAAGMASRYGSQKQTDGFGPKGETIMEYSIYDALKAGFGKVVFIIREDFADAFKAQFEPKLNGKIPTEYVYQSYDLKPFGIDKEIERAKPWGTAHAMLAARDVVNEPFCVINADDFYGYDAFKKIADFLTSEVSSTNYGLVGYYLEKTLSEHGSVSRGVCDVDSNGNLEAINERTTVYEKDGKVVYEDESGAHELRPENKASMNFWGFTPDVFSHIEKQFVDFVHANADKPKAEFFIPLVADDLIKKKKADFKVIPTDSKWFGVTYKEDKPVVIASLQKLSDAGEYPENLWA